MLGYTTLSFIISHNTIAAVLQQLCTVDNGIFIWLM